MTKIEDGSGTVLEMDVPDKRNWGSRNDEDEDSKESVHHKRKNS